MRRIILITALSFLSAPALAQGDATQEGTDLMGEALRLFMQGLMQEMEPALNEMEGFLDNLDAYHPPEVLPNGDIIIRRKTPEDNGTEDDIEI